MRRNIKFIIYHSIIYSITKISPWNKTRSEIYYAIHPTSNNVNNIAVENALKIEMDKL
jgi:hypothetical protein